MGDGVKLVGWGNSHGPVPISRRRDPGDGVGFSPDGPIQMSHRDTGAPAIILAQGSPERSEVPVVHMDTLTTPYREIPRPRDLSLR